VRGAPALDACAAAPLRALLSLSLSLSLAAPGRHLVAVQGRVVRGRPPLIGLTGWPGARPSTCACPRCSSSSRSRSAARRSTPVRRGGRGGGGARPAPAPLLSSPSLARSSRPSPSAASPPAHFADEHAVLSEQNGGQWQTGSGLLPGSMSRHRLRPVGLYQVIMIGLLCGEWSGAPPRSRPETPTAPRGSPQLSSWPRAPRLSSSRCHSSPLLFWLYTKRITAFTTHLPTDLAAKPSQVGGRCRRAASRIRTLTIGAHPNLPDRPTEDQRSTNLAAASSPRVRRAWATPTSRPSPRWDCCVAPCKGGRAEGVGERLRRPLPLLFPLPPQAPATSPRRMQ